MKKLITNDKTIVPIAANKQDPYGMPTPEQLAQLAAILSKNYKEDLSQLAERALTLWCAAETVHYKMSNHYYSPTKQIEYLNFNLPTTRDQFLKKALPKKRKEDRLKAWRIYNLIQDRIDPEKATPDQKEEAGKFWRTPKTNEECFEEIQAFLQHWGKYHAGYISKLRGKASSKKK